MQLPYSLQQIGDEAFARCTSLSELTIPSGVPVIGKEAFTGCWSLADADGFVILNSTLYRYWGSDEDVKIPDGVSEIADLAFRGMQVKSVTIPDSVKVIGKDAFLLCPNLRTVHT